MGEQTMMRVFILMAMASLALGGLSGKTGIYSDSACTTKIAEYDSSFGSGCQKVYARVYNNDTKKLSVVYPTTVGQSKSYMVVGTINTCAGGQKFNYTAFYRTAHARLAKRRLIGLSSNIRVRKRQ